MTPVPPAPGHPHLDEGRGEWRDGNARYLLIRSDSLMGMFHRLPPVARRDALSALAASVAEAGGHSAARYRAVDANDEALLRRVGEVAPRLGWGLWTFERPAPDELRLEVANSPFAAAFGKSAEPVCAPILGMLSALAGMAMGGPVTTEEISCATSAGGPCRFVARAKPV